MGMAVGVKWAQATSERRSISDSVSHGHGVKHSEPSRLFQDLQRFHAIPKGTWLGQELTFFSACSPSTCLPHPRWPPWPLPAAGAQSTPALAAVRGRRIAAVGLPHPGAAPQRSFEGRAIQTMFL